MSRTWRFLIISLLLLLSGAIGIGTALVATTADVQNDSERGGDQRLSSDQPRDKIGREPNGMHSQKVEIVPAP